MSVLNNNILAGSSGQGGGGAAVSYSIEKSLRFTEGDTSYLNRTFSSTSSSFTVSFWMKLGRVDGAGSYDHIFSCSGNDGSAYYFGVTMYNNTLYIFNGSHNNSTGRLLRDPSAWYHVVCSVSSNTGTLYVNNEQVQQVTGCKYGGTCHIGNWAGTGYHFDGYLADVHFVDGTALAATDFGEFDATTGVWNPKAYTGAYGTNGFHLTFSDNSTAAALGTDTSGNGNTWTINNISAATGGPTSVAAASGALPIYNTTDTYGTVKGTGTRTDSNSSSLVLALPMDGANNSTTFTDESAPIKGSGSAKTVTAYGNAQVSTAQSKYYGSSGYFDGSGDYLTLPGNTDFSFDGDFTIELWIKTSTISLNTFYRRVVSTGPDISTSIQFLFLDGSGASSNISVRSSGQLINGTIPAATGDWVHVALTRSGSAMKLFVNGTQSGSTATRSNAFTAGATSGLTVGRYQGGNGHFEGYIQDLRIYKGAAKYTSNFIPPSITQDTTIADDCDSLVDVPTNGTETDTGFGGEVRGNYAVLNALVLSSTGSLSNGNLKFYSSSGYQNARSTIGVTSGKWYAEFTIDVSACYIGIGLNALPAAGWVGNSIYGWAYHPNGNIYHTGQPASYGNAFTTGDLIGLAFDADNRTAIWYKNGASQGSYSLGSNAKAGDTFFFASGTYTGMGYTANFGQRPFAYDISMGISDATGATPVLSTSDDYGQTLSSGTATDSDSANLVLALPMNGSNGGTTFTDYSATIKGSGSAKTVTPSGDVKTSTVQSRYYGSSGYFDGSGDYLTIPASSEFDFGTGDFTVEFWMFRTALTSYATIIDNNYGTSPNFLLQTSTSLGQRWRLYLSGISVSITEGSDHSLDTWHHYAVVRNGAGSNNVVIYRDGTSVATGTFTGNVGNASVVYGIGARPNGTLPFAGYIQDFRIYKGNAKYTSNFTPPTSSGYKALCTTNLPAPTIANGSEYMDVALYTGNGSTQTISGLGFSPDLVWIKERSQSINDHILKTSLQTRFLSSNGTVAERGSSGDLITSLDSTGFTVNTTYLGGSSNSSTNGLNVSYVAWTWDAGSSTVTNNDGSITSQVRANPSAGFSIVTYTGTGASGATVGHGLNAAAPGFIIVKQRIAGPGTALYNWNSYHSSLGATKYIALNTTAAAGTGPVFNDTTPTSTVFSLGSSTGSYNNVNNANGVTYCAFCFAPVAAYSSFGSYTGNGSTDGSFTYLEFLPKLILIKRTDTTSNWTILDTSREGYNVDNDPLYPNLSNAEGTTDILDITSNGFKLRTTDASVNASGGTYIYAAFAESPFSLARAR